MAVRAFRYDHKSHWVESERLRQELSTKNWIYIGVDTQRNNMAKIGLTTNTLGTRASSSQNPFYTLLCAFKIEEGVDPKKILDMEKSVKDFLSQQYDCIQHVDSGRRSEWFYINPLEMRECVHNFLYEHFSREMYCHYCSTREIGVIHSWENLKLLQGTPRPPYQANDLSSPPIDPNCFMPGGCGKDCDCWD